MSEPASSSAEIARRAKSNLAFALACMPEERRRDMISFYAYCRVVDDIADSTTLSPEAKDQELNRWRSCVNTGELVGEPVLDEVTVLPAKYDFPREWLAEIIDGVASDLGKVRYQTYEELLAYCYKVASVVGLVSAEIFGAARPQARDFAIQLGYALQLTNIIRDVGQDAEESGRIYLPLEDLVQFGLTENDILHRRYTPKFVEMMDWQYQRARRLYDDAERLLPVEDREALLPARLMGQIYLEILEKLKKQRYPVFDTRVRLHPLRKVWLLIKYSVMSWWARRPRH